MMTKKMQRRPPRSLADFLVPIPLYCFHCDARFVNRAPVSFLKGYAVVQCTNCRCCTPFKLEIRSESCA